jgi:YD repeat-containing protein
VQTEAVAFRKGGVLHVIAHSVVVGRDRAQLRVQYITADDETETHSSAGRLLSLQNRAGLTQNLEYDERGRLMSVRDAFGACLAICL